MLSQTSQTPFKHDPATFDDERPLRPALRLVQASSSSHSDPCRCRHYMKRLVSEAETSIRPSTDVVEQATQPHGVAGEISSRIASEGGNGSHTDVGAAIEIEWPPVRLVEAGAIKSESPHIVDGVESAS